MQVELLTRQDCPSVARFLIAQREWEKSRDVRLWSVPDLPDLLEERLLQSLNDSAEQIWLARNNQGQLLGVLGGQARSLNPYDTRRTYLAAHYGFMPVLFMAAQPGCWIEVMSQLWPPLRRWFSQSEVRQPQVWLNACHTEAFAAWQTLGFEWLMDHALRPLTPADAQPLPPPPGLKIRPATPRDTSRIMPLFLEELHFHADLPGNYWIKPGPDTPRLARREIEIFLTAGTEYRYLLAERPGERALLGYMNATVAPPLPGHVNTYFSPPGRGMLQVGVVREPVRGRGVGRVLLSNLLKWFYDQQMHSVSLSYDVRNPLSGPFWRGQGFVPLRRALVCDISQR